MPTTEHTFKDLPSHFSHPAVKDWFSQLPSHIEPRITRKAEGASRAVASALCAVAVLAGAGVTLGMFALGTSATKMFM